MPNRTNGYTRDKRGSQLFGIRFNGLVIGAESEVWMVMEEREFYQQKGNIGSRRSDRDFSIDVSIKVVIKPS